MKIIRSLLPPAAQLNKEPPDFHQKLENYLSGDLNKRLHVTMSHKTTTSED